MNTNKQIQNAIKEILFATTAHKALSKSTGHNEKKKVNSFLNTDVYGYTINCDIQCQDG